MNQEKVIGWLRMRGLSKESEDILVSYIKEPKNIANFLLMIEAFRNNQHVVYMECFPSHFTCLSVDSAKLNGFISLIGFQSELFKVRTRLEGAISSLGMQLGMADEQKLSSLEKVNFLANPMLQEVLVKGLPSLPAKAAELDLVVKPITENPEYIEKDDGSVDYADLNLFENVVAEQHIADHIPPRAGVPGRDIYGTMISAHQNLKDMVMCGPNVLYDEHAQKYFAAKAGYVSLKDGKINVEDIYVVERNVDFRVGNINFVSDVRVKGDVLSDFSITTGGNLEILGTVTGAALQVEKDLKLALGVLGQGKARIRVHGKASTKFLNETKFDCLGPVEIYREALNAELSTMDEIHAKNAVFIGGKIVSLKTIHIGTLGSELGIKTYIYLGEDFNILSRSEQLFNSIVVQKERVKMLYEQEQGVVLDWQFNKIEDNYSMAKLENDMVRLEVLKEAIDELVSLHEEYESLVDDLPADREPICYVYNMLYAGTSFHCLDAKLSIKEDMKGPLKIFADKNRKNKKTSISIEQLK